MDVAFNQIITRWAWVAIAVLGILLSYCVILKLHESGIYPIREATKIIRRPWFETALLLFIVGGLIQYGATKGTNGTAGVNRPGLMQRSDLQLDDADGFEGALEESFAITNLCFTRIAPLSNSVVPAKLLSAGYAEYIRDGKYLPSVCVNENQQVMVGELEDLDTCVNGYQHYGKVSSTNIVTESRESIRGSISIGQSSSPVFLLVEGTPVLLLIKHLGYQDALQWNPTWGPTLSHYVNIIQQEIDSWEGAGTYRLDMIDMANFEGIMPGRE